MSLYLFERISLKKRIFELVEKAGYIVRVSKVGDNKLLTLFPNRLFGHPQYKNNELIHEIEPNKDGYKIRRFEKDKWRVFIVPDYVVRPFIIQDIYLKCGFLGIDHDLVFGYDENNNKVKKLIDAVPKPEGVDETKEVACAKLFIAKNLGEDVSKETTKYGVGAGVDFIANFMYSSAKKFLNDEILE